MRSGYTMVLPDRDKYSQTRSEMLDSLAYMLGGMAAEALIFHDVTSGAGNDIEKATGLARAMVTQYGMTERLGAVKLGDSNSEPFLGRDMGHTRNYSEETAAKVDDEIKALLGHAHQEAFEILHENRDVLDALVLALLDKETLDKGEIAAIFEPLTRRPTRPAWTGSPERVPSTIPPVDIPQEIRDRVNADIAAQQSETRWRDPHAARRGWRRPRRPRRPPGHAHPAQPGRAVTDPVTVPQVAPEDVPAFDQARAEAAVRELLARDRRGPRARGAARDAGAGRPRLRRAHPGPAPEPEDVLTTTFDLGHEEMVLVRDIELWSMCEHHLVPFTGVAHVGYIPAETGKITGLSKLARLVDVYAKRPQVQERLTTQVADSLMEILEARGVIVVIEAEHLCMTMRGVKKAGARTITSAVRGMFLTHAGHPRRGDGAHPLRHQVSEGASPADRSTRVMGIVNVTPDSFSDGGRWDTTEAAVAHGRHLVAQGADVLDIGGESTRPGATRPLVAEELDRVVPVIRELATDGVVVSVDTMRAEVAAAAIDAGAGIVNDVSGGLADPRILDVVADSDASYVAMHWRAHADRMRDFTDYSPDGVVESVRRELGERLDAVLAAGVPQERVVLDPGLGFAKKPSHNWELLAALDGLRELGCPLLVGASRKSFLGSLLAVDGVPRPVDEREHAHVALVALLAVRGVDLLRVHDVRATRDALAVVAAMDGGTT